MAVIAEVPGIVVTIDVAGQDVHEYNDADVEEPQPNTSYTYVQAESGADFGVAVRFDPAVFPYVREQIRVQLSMDGNSITGKTYSTAETLSGRRGIMKTVTQDLGDRYVVQKFSFAELIISTLSKMYLEMVQWRRLTWNSRSQR